MAFGRLKKPPQIVEMAANGNLIFQDTNKATFVGANSNVVIDTVHASFGVGVDVNGPTSNLHVVGNAYVSSNLTVTGNTFYTNPAAVLVDSNVVTEYTGPHDRPLRKYPEVAMTANDNSSTSGYVASASSEFTAAGPYSAWEAFDSITGGSSYWSTNSGTYTTSNPPTLSYTGTAFATNVEGVNKYGEWLQIEFPHKVKYSYSTILAPTDHEERVPRDGYIVGSNDLAGQWTTLHRFEDVTRTTTTETVTYTPPSAPTQFFRYFRLVIEALTTGGANFAGVDQWELYGYEEGSGSLDTTLKSVYNVPATTGTQLEVYYDGQDYSGVTSTVTDKVGTATNATISNSGSTITFDSTYKAWTFGGSSGRTDTFRSSSLPSTFTGNQVHSITLWFNMSNISDGSIFVITPSGGENGGDVIMGQTQGDGARISYSFWGNDVSFDLPTNLATGSWYHLSMTYDATDNSTGRKMFLNGIECTAINTASGSLSLPNSNMIISFANRVSQTTYPFFGSIANFRLYSKALNAEQVKELYDYQKDYFLGSKSQVTLYKGHLGVGVTEPSGQLELAGDERLQEYPPRAMTGFDTHIEGHGVFKASASSQHSGTFEPWGVFSDTNDYNLDIWVSGSADWSSTDGTPVVLHYLADNTPGGSWLKIEMPYKIKLDSFSFVTGTRSYSTETFPENFQIWASNNGTEWNQIYSVSGFGNPPNETGGTTWGHTNVNSQTYYSMYAMVITKLYMVGTQTRTFASIPRWKLFGTPGPTTLDKGSLSLGRSLDVPRISRYDVDTETPRPEKLVVDFDTTVNESPTDISGQGNHGTFGGSAYYSAADKAFNFDQSDDYIQTGAGVISGTNPVFSISLWVNYSGTGSETFCMIGDTYGTNTTVWCDVADGNQKPRMNFINNDVSFTDPNTGLGALVPGVWNHLVYVFNGTPNGGRSAYVNGVKQVASAESGTSADGNLVLPSSSVITIGALDHSSGFIHELFGKISNFKIYTVALELSEVKKLYNLGRTGRSMVISDTAVGIGKVPEAQLDVRGVANFERVGIGVDNPGKTLDVNGTTRSRKNAGWKSGTFDSTGVNMGPLADGTTDGAQIGWEFHVTFSAATAGSRVEIYGAYKHSGPLYAANEKWTFRFKEGVGTPDYSNFAELVNDAEPNADTYYAVIRVVNSIYNNTNVVAARHHFMSHSVGCHRSIGATIWQAQGYIDMGGESVDDRFNYLRLTSSSGNIKGQWTVFPITT
jgi:hypothetical protein